jgi:small subunit ribosomal protein S6
VNDYEIMLLLDPETAEERAGEIIQRIRTTVEEAGGTWETHEPWGRRRLAFEIDHKGEAIYHLMLFTCPPETLEEIVRVLKITDGVMRHGAYRRVKGTGHLKPPSQIAAPQESAPEAPRRPAPAPAAAATEDEPAPEEAPAEAEAEAPEPVASAVAASEASDDTDGAAE